MSGLHDVTAVVVTFNSERTIRRSLRSLETSELRPRVVVVDNASTDATTATLAAEFPELPVVVSQRNVGFAAACNLGMASPHAGSPAYFLFVNPDAYLEPTCLQVMVEEMEARPDAAVASPLVLDARTGAIWYAGAEADVEHGIYWHHGVGEADDGQYTETVETGRPTGCVMLVRRAAVDDVGAMDPTYFLYWEEVEWTLRFRSRGRSVLFIPRARALHDVSSTTGGPTSPVYEYYYLRNRLRLVRASSGMSRRALVAANLRGSVDTIGGAYRLKGIRDAGRAARAITLAYSDFLRDRYGQRARL